jgi:uncharacterized Rossmann fold enzyme
LELPYSNLQIEHWNPGATSPLVLPVHLICNTSDDDIHANIYANSRLDKEWLRLEDAHDRVAVLCGSGPSLADTLDEIRARVKDGAAVFAMNGAARFLTDNGVRPDYQCIIDARIETANLIDLRAKEHLFGSQVHPECFKRVPDARLWHLQIGTIDDLLPEYKRSYCLIGGAASVGNTATCLAYAMGYRTMHLYGYDSCHRDGSGHAFRQPMNDGDPCASVRFGGKDYIASLTMKLQAEKFQETAGALVDAGCKIEVHGTGLLPDMWRARLDGSEFYHSAASEAAKYARIWEIPEYRRWSPGEESVDQAIAAMGMRAGEKVIDFGCGTGRASAAFAKRGMAVLGVDHVTNCLDPDIEIPFVKANLWELPRLFGEYGFCADVMEHIPTERVGQVLAAIRGTVPAAFFRIAFHYDNFGSVIGEPLHLTVRPMEWWRAALKAHWPNVEYLGDGSFTCKQEKPL